MRYAWWIVAAVLALAPPAWAAWDEPNVPEAKEFRLLKFYPQARVMEYAVKDFDSEKMLTAYTKGDPDQPTFEEIEGRVTQYIYEHKPTTSTLEILRNYENVLKAKGFQAVVSGKATAYPALELGNDITVGYYRLEEPGGGTVWLHMEAWYNGGRDQPQSKLIVVETRPMEQKLQGNAAAMQTALAETGRVAVYGINFDFGKATLRPDSASVLGDVLALLNAEPGLRIGIEGHTDNVGQPAFNRKLSADRAASVKTWLVANGIDAGRLQTAGYGDTRPLADNRSDEGRAKNRRV
jgi:outer membrane protein OmpA-like peptidoglycan-associated protein